MTGIEDIRDSAIALAEPGEQPAGDASPPLVEPSPAEPIVSELAALDSRRRSDWAGRIRDEIRLPGSLRDRLAAAVEEASELSGDSEPRLTVTQVANVFAESLPTLLALDGLAAVAPHPIGEAFFRGGQLSDDDAAHIAREQLARTGFAGQLRR